MDDNMNNDIVSDIANLVDRVDGLESGQSNALTVARIVKVYPKLGIRTTIVIKKKHALFMRTNTTRFLYPSNNLYINGNTILTKE